MLLMRSERWLWIPSESVGFDVLSGKIRVRQYLLQKQGEDALEIGESIEYLRFKC